MALQRPARQVLSVAGTNGKGSTVAFIEAIAAAAGLRVGAYTSPHLLRYNERLRIAGREVADADWIAAFERVEAVRGDTALTYFEFGTLAALDIMRSEEHTSELQSLMRISYAVFCLKKKKKTT